MFSRATKLRFRRRLRMRKLQVEEFSEVAEANLERNFYRRLSHLIAVRRFVVVWLAVVILLGIGVVAQLRSLGNYYLDQKPAPGGTYNEGIVGAFTNANPIYANTPADMTVSKLIFASLFKYDDNNNLVGDLASGWTVDSSGKVYTVTLRPHLTWQDGKPLTADDVAFTYSAIQNPDARSPFGSSWRGIVVRAENKTTVSFTLPSQLASFPYSLTNGIVPQHILGKVAVQDLRTIAFNTTNPVGAGPFAFGTLEVVGRSSETREEHIGLNAFAHYHSGAPKLDHFVVYTFRSEERMISSFQAQHINAMADLTNVPHSLRSNDAVKTVSFPLTAGSYVFFRTTQPLFQNAAVRQALVQATDTTSVIHKLGYPAEPVRSPLLPGQIGYNALYLQPEFNLANARVLLDQAGWIVGKSGIRANAGQELKFTLDVQDNNEYRQVARTLQAQWRQLGVQVVLAFHDNTDFQSVLSSHSYDAVLYGISIGKDPDVYVYWDSKSAAANAENRLNFSEYKSTVADTALESGRTRTDPAIRAVKYQPFLQAWRDDAPAVGLYQPRFLYVTRGEVYGLNVHSLNAEVERLDSADQWMIHQTRVSQTK